MNPLRIPAAEDFLAKIPFDCGVFGPPYQVLLLERVRVEVVHQIGMSCV